MILRRWLVVGCCSPSVILLNRLRLATGMAYGWTLAASAFMRICGNGVDAVDSTLREILYTSGARTTPSR